MLAFGTLFINAYSSGWAEVYPLNVPDYATAVTNLTTLWNNRKAMLVSDAELVYARVSDSAVKGDSFPTGLPFPIPGTYAIAPADVSGNLDLALRTQFTGAVTQRAQRWIRAVPGSQFGTGGQYVPAGTWAAKRVTYEGSVSALVSVAHRIPGAIVPPFYTFTPISNIEQGLIFYRRKIGRPFGLRPGRRLVA